MSSIAWTDVRKAIFDWVVATSGIDADHVIWEEQRGPQPPTGTYIAMMVQNVRPFGLDWIEITDQGEGIKHTLRGPRVGTLVLQCFAGGDRWIDAQPQDRLETVITSRALPSRALALADAGVGFGTINPVEALSIERSTLFEPRARVEVTIHLTSAVEELGGYIESVELTETIGDIERVLHIGGTNAIITLASMTVTGVGNVPVLGFEESFLGVDFSVGVGELYTLGNEATTLANLTQIAVGTVPVEASESTTLDGDTTSATGTVAVDATETSSLGADTSVAAGIVFTLGAEATTLANLTQVATGSAPSLGTESTTLDSLPVTASGNVPVDAAESTQLDGDTQVAAGIVLSLGDLATTFDALTQSSAGTVPVVGSETTTLDNLPVSASGNVPVEASESTQLADDLNAAVGDIPVDATESTTLDNDTNAAAGTVT